MESESSQTNRASAWPHRWAVLLTCATFPVIWLGGLVTTTEAGMAVPDWPTTYGYNLFLYPWQTWLFGPWDLFVEHGHRLLAGLINLIAIGLCLSVWRHDARRSARWLTLITLVAVVVQDVLGGLRVELDRDTFAMVHACVGPAFFALSAAMAVITSRWWRSASAAGRPEDTARVLPHAVMTAALGYGQIVLGAQLRHVSILASPGSFRTVVLLHLVTAAALAAYTIVLVARVLRARNAVLSRPAIVLMTLVSLQLVLGAGAWVLNYQWPSWLGEHAWNAGHVNVQEGIPQVAVTTAHVAIGSAIFVTCVTLALRAGRLLRRPLRGTTPSGTTRLGVAA